MDGKHLFFIVNPAAGKDEPVLEKIAGVFQDSGIRLTVHVLQKTDDPAKIVREAIPGADLIAVYGGDGSVTQAASALIGTKTPLAIIPGGTANVLANELGIPEDTAEALTLLRDGKFQLKQIDTGLVNDRPFLLRVNLGIMAEMITGTDPGLKEKIGQLAYGVATLNSIREAEPVNYRLNIDGREMEVSGVSLTITNSGSMGIGGLELQPGISVSDGLLDVVLLKNAGFLAFVKAAGGVLLGRETGEVSHWTGKVVKVTLPAEQLYLCDDCEDKASELVIKIVPSSLTVITPKTT